MANYRSWTWLGDAFADMEDLAAGDERIDAEMERRTPAIEALVARWNEIAIGREEKSFRRMSEDDDPGYDPGPSAYELAYEEYDGQEELDSPEWRKAAHVHARAVAQAAELKEQTMRELEQEEVAAIESKLADLGVRIMRPYEHWNEDERYVEYMERDR